MKFLQILVLILGLVTLANAQKSILSGTIYDQDGAIIPNAEVKLKNKKNKIYKAKTSADGVYEIELPKGFYSIEVTSNNFKIFRVKKYFISPVFKGKMFCDIALNPIGEVSDKNGFF